MGSPRPTPQSPLPHPHRINVRARRALHIYYLLFLIYYLDCPSGAISSPMVHPFAMSREIATKNSLTLSVRLYFGALCSGLSRGLTKPHRGFVVGRYEKRPTRPVLVPDGAPTRSVPGNCNKKTPLLPPLICTFHSFPRGLSRGLTKPHWGFVVGRYARRPTRPVLVPDGAPVRSVPGNCNKKTPRNFLRGVCFGAPSGTRTQDPLIKSQLLYQLS